MFSRCTRCALETVAWISEQMTTLSAVFYLAAALTYLHFDQTRRRSHYFLALGLFMLALLSKTVTATLPAALTSCSLVAAEATQLETRCAAVVALVHSGRHRGTCYRVAGATIYSRGGYQFRTDAGRAVPVSWASDLVLPG
jgi:hypothetical protein